MANRGSRMTKAQKETLVTYIEQNKNMLQPKQTLSNLPKVEVLWRTLVDNLNNQKGAKKSIKQWKEAWNELKTNVRRKARDNKFDIIGTGGGEKKAKVLTDLEERVLQLISKIVVEGAPHLPEAGFASTTFNLNVDNLEENNIENEIYIDYVEQENEDNENIPEESSQQEYIQEYIVLPSNAEEESRLKRRPKPRALRTKRKDYHHPLQQVLHTHEKCLQNVAASNIEIDQALLQLSASLTFLGKSINRRNRCAMSKLKL